MDGIPSKISLFSELTVSSDSDDDTRDDVTRDDVITGPVEAWAEEAPKKSCKPQERNMRIPSTMPEEEEGRCGSCNPPLVVRMTKQLPQAIVDRNKAQERAVVLKEKRKREMISRRKEELALERKLKFKPRYIQITPPAPQPKLTHKPETKLFIKTPQPHKSTDSLDFSTLMNVKSLSSADTGLSQADIDSFVRQSKMTRDMLNINFNKNNSLSLVFNDKADKCENLLRKEIRRHKARKNPTYCIIK